MIRLHLALHFVKHEKNSSGIYLQQLHWLYFYDSRQKLTKDCILYPFHIIMQNDNVLKLCGKPLNCLESYLRHCFFVWCLPNGFMHVKMKRFNIVVIFENFAAIHLSGQLPLRVIHELKAFAKNKKAWQQSNWFVAITWCQTWIIVYFKFPELSCRWRTTNVDLRIAVKTVKVSVL